MRRLFRFGAPKPRHFAMQFGYDKQPTFWHEVRSNAHLIIAGVGTAALLSVAAFALWLALPADDRQAVASTDQVVPAIPVRTIKIAPTQNSGPAPTVAEVKQTTVKGNAAVQPNTPDEDAAIVALSSSDPRWSAPAGKTPAAATRAASTEPAPQPSQPSPAPLASASATGTSSAVSAFAPSPTAAAAAAVRADPLAADAKPQSDETAAIPAAKPAQPDDDADSAVDPGAKKTQAAGNGRILRSVTMRSGPKKNAPVVMGAVPANASVQVISCSSWCQIVYKGKRGWIYKGFLSGSGGNSAASDPVRTKSVRRKPQPAKASEPEAQQLPGVDPKILGRS